MIILGEDSSGQAFILFYFFKFPRINFYSRKLSSPELIILFFFTFTTILMF